MRVEDLLRSCEEGHISVTCIVVKRTVSPSLKMSSVSAASCEATPPVDSTEKKPLKPCCACPETKKARDACIIEKGEESCTDLIEAHKECMRALGFKI
ncbi:hypothetical protein GJAV_G00212930 [Gymnothorax javanicus]|nr:hypothetical protein GJAV_G00212930 [Gymnothorax javanicus]